MDQPQPGMSAGGAETYNPWTVVNLVFHHLVAEGLHPTLGEGGDPRVPAEELLRALGIAPMDEGSQRVTENVKQELADIRAAVLDEDP